MHKHHQCVWLRWDLFLSSRIYISHSLTLYLIMCFVKILMNVLRVEFGIEGWEKLHLLSLENSTIILILSNRMFQGWSRLFMTMIIIMITRSLGNLHVGINELYVRFNIINARFVNVIILTLITIFKSIWNRID